MLRWRCLFTCQLPTQLSLFQYFIWEHLENSKQEKRLQSNMLTCSEAARIEMVYFLSNIYPWCSGDGLSLQTLLKHPFSLKTNIRISMQKAVRIHPGDPAGIPMQMGHCGLKIQTDSNNWICWESYLKRILLLIPKINMVSYGVYGLL